MRCAIYTRKSSEEGLEQDFNSLHAQREACAAYVLSQASEGWSLLPQEYDDGGLSGGTLERPALQRLLADIAAGRIDIVVVYKVDRLTRSLLDFARLVEAFDAEGTSFVSVTQSFNTTTSMGRLTLNMLLSFAQFEREVTAERIRDKIAASKARGMWMGGNPPLGYRPEGRSLEIVPDHAELIRELFQRYLAIGNVRLLAEQLAADRIQVPLRRSLTGRQMGGGAFTRGQIYKILSNPIYLGEIHHKGRVYDGKHEAIIDRGLWDQVQAKLADNTQGQQRSPTAKSPSLLAGRIFDETGEPLVAAHATKNKVRYRYYVSRALQHEAGAGTSGSNEPRLRVPALELEKAVAEGVAALFDDPLDLACRAGIELRPDRMAKLQTSAQRVAVKLRKRDRSSMRALIGRVTVERERIEVEFDAAAITEMLGAEPSAAAPDSISITIDARIRRTGLAVKLVHNTGRAAVQDPQEHLIRLLAKAKTWWREMQESGMNAKQLGARHGVTGTYIGRVVRLNFLAPSIAESILAGNQPAALDGKRLLGLRDLPLDWSEQESALRI
ncbi:MAG: recombinase family protein [Novosphingobium sp.]|nr:recombinase family protein [Novosphingobium sp.]